MESRHPPITYQRQSTQSRLGMFRRAVPAMPRGLAWICFILNLIFPGTGSTLIPLVDVTWKTHSRNINQRIFRVLLWET